MVNNILDYLENSANKYPDKIAFSDIENQISFADLMIQAKVMGCKIVEEVINQVNQPIIVIAQRNISTILAFIGILYSGNFYVPVDYKMPEVRLDHIFTTVNPAAVLDTGNNSVSSEKLSFKGPVISLEEAQKHSINQVLLDKIRQNATDNDPLFAVFTSGSTGVPKCFQINHCSVIDLVEHFSSLFSFSSEIVLGNQAPLDYDGSVKEICLTLKNGSRMHIIPKMYFSFPAMLFKHMDEMKINTINWSTSALRIIASLKALDKVKPEFVKRFFFSGEVMPNKVLNYFRKHFPGSTFVNLYGPTEITFNCTYFIVSRPFKDDEPLPIGTPFPNTKILVLNENDTLVDQGEIGEICVSGNSLALGYYNNPEATSKAFVQNPLNSVSPERIYRTGDLGKFNRLGELMFVSRKDQQIKHMGYRIELGEIEAAAQSLDDIQSTCCVYDQTKDNLVLFYQANKSDDQALLTKLRERLPRYMLPSRLVHYQKLPVTTTGKIDRLVLRKTLNT